MPIVSVGRVWELEIEDLTHLGGPMGSEYTTTVSVQLFKTEKQALAAAKDDHRRRFKNQEPFPDVYIDTPERKTYDAMSVGYVIRCRNVHVWRA